MSTILLAIGRISYNISVFWNTSVLPIRKYKGTDANKNNAYYIPGRLLLILPVSILPFFLREDPQILNEFVTACGLVCNFCPIICMGKFHGASSLKIIRSWPLSYFYLFPLPSCFWNIDEMAVAEAATLDNALTLEMETSCTEHQDKRGRPVRTSQSGNEVSREPWQLTAAWLLSEQVCGLLWQERVCIWILQIY